MLALSTINNFSITDHIRVALAGNPNCGKTSIFNALTGAHQHVANYPGVTVEKRIGLCKLDNCSAEVIDLPGTYSLNSYSPEERVAEIELLNMPDVVVIVADSTQLQRNLVLLVQIMQIGANPVLCLNMADEARANGLMIDLKKMEQLLGFPVVETVGHTRKGIAELKSAIQRAAQTPVIHHNLVFDNELDRAITSICALLSCKIDSMKSLEWIAIRLLLSDTENTKQLEVLEKSQAIVEAHQQRTYIQSITGKNISVFVTESYFRFVKRLLNEVVTQPPQFNVKKLTDKIDAVVVHRVLGLPIFALVMFVIFGLTFSVGEYPMGWIEAAVNWVGVVTASLWPDGSNFLLRSLLVDGIIGGIGGVIVFLPNILLLFLGLAFLEDTGYMARVAFITDRLMHRFGLHGKSFIPMMIGFGCSVPGIMATRTLENERDRIVTMLVLPLMSCGARFPIWMLLIPAFFPPAWRAPILWLIYAVGIMLALGLALLLRKTLLCGDDAPFVMELPPYRFPTLRSVIIKMIERSALYLRKAGTSILGISILMWAATTFPKPSSYRVDTDIATGQVVVQSDYLSKTLNDARPHLTLKEVEDRRATENLEYSIAGRVGRILEPIFSPLGFDWKSVTAMIGAFVAKEVFIAQMGIVYSIADADESNEGLRAQLSHDYSPLVGLSMILFLLVSAPCMATIVVTRRESGHWRWALLQLGGLTAIAYILSLLLYQIGRFIF